MPARPDHGFTARLNDFGKYTAFQHGSVQPQKLREGGFIIDDGCAIDSYQSGITRTIVFGKPAARQTETWWRNARRQTGENIRRRQRLPRP
ncbi:MAG: M24 family metallopeptidase [Bryobacteraceae bacterium]